MSSNGFWKSKGASRTVKEPSSSDSGNGSAMKTINAIRTATAGTAAMEMALEVTMAGGQISGARTGDAMKSRPGASARMNCAGGKMIASAPGNSTSSICDKCGA